MFELTLSQALGMSGKKDGDPIGASKLNKVDIPPLNSQWKENHFILQIITFIKKNIYIIWEIHDWNTLTIMSVYYVKL